MSPCSCAITPRNSAPYRRRLLRVGPPMPSHRSPVLDELGLSCRPFDIKEAHLGFFLGQLSFEVLDLAADLASLALESALTLFQLVGALPRGGLVLRFLLQAGRPGHEALRPDVDVA